MGEKCDYLFAADVEKFMTNFVSPLMAIIFMFYELFSEYGKRLPDCLLFLHFSLMHVF